MKRKVIATLLVAAMAVSMAACGAKQDAPSEPAAEASATEEAEETEANDAAADLVLMNGTIQTMVSEDDKAEAVAVKDGVIVYVGDNDGVQEFITDSTNVIDLNGEYVTPGFIDGHTHTVQNTLQREAAVYLNETEPTVEAYKEVLQKFVDEHPDDEFIYGTGLNLNAFENAVPTNDWIDEICPDKAVKIIDMSVHGALVNQKGLDLCGITKDTEVPMNGIFYKDDAGELTGYFSDCWSLFTGIPEQEFTDEQFIAAMEAYEAECNAYGITGIDTGGDVLDPHRERSIYSQMEKDGNLTLRVNSAHFASNPYTKEEAEKQIAVLDEDQKYASDFIKVSQIKATFDGVPEAMTVSVLEPFAETSGMPADYYGPELTPQDDLNQYVAAINAAGYQANVHTMGDASVRAALDAYQYSIDQNGEGDYRNIITHLNLVKEEDAKRLSEMGVFAAMQPIWWYYDPIFSPLEVISLGEERFATEYHIADLVSYGTKITGSVDYPITLDFRPLAGIQVGATQCSPYPGEEDDDTFLRNADQVVSVYEMLKMYTIYGAEQMEMEDLIGTIEVGKKADMAVMSYDITACDPKDIADAEIVYTISDGRIVFEN